MLVGSVAKGTFLKDPDIDVFIRFSPSYSRKDMENLGLEIARSVMPDGYESYAEHPYLRGVVNGFRVDIVPCYMVDDPSKKISAVDRTPFHTEYVKENLRDEQKDEVRLLKAFMKGIGVYGAEARVEGFSGYLCELLVIKYGSFMSVLKHASQWKKRTYLHLGNGGARFNAPLTFIDPVDSNRNVASAVSEQSKSLFTIASREFLQEPKLTFFFPNPVKVREEKEILAEIEKRKTRSYAIIFPKPDVVDDVLYPQIKRTMRAFESILQEFIPLHTFYYVDDSHVVFLLELERDELPHIMKHQGPPVWHENAEKFMERWRNEALRGPYVLGNRLYVDRERKHRYLKDYLIKALQAYALGKEFEKRKGDMLIEKLEDVLHRLDLKNISEFLYFKFPWER